MLRISLYPSIEPPLLGPSCKDLSIRMLVSIPFTIYTLAWTMSWFAADLDPSSHVPEAASSDEELEEESMDVCGAL